MQFQLKALHPTQGVVSLALDAIDADAATRQAHAQGYTVLSIHAARRLLAARQRRLKFPLSLFSQELLALLAAGLSLMEAVETLAEKESRADVKQVLDQLIGYLYEGQSFSYALGQFPAVFPELYVATVRASEKTGDLDEALSRYVAYQGQLDVVRKKIVSAAIYPVLLLAVGMLVVLFLMVYVVPKFSKIYEDMGDNLPLLSQLLMQWGRLLAAYAPEMLAGFVGVIALLVFVFTRPATRRWFGQRLRSIPAVGERMRVYQLARFYRTMGMLLRGGIPMVTAMEMASGLLSMGLRDPLRAAATSIREGRSLSQSMEAQHLTTPVSLRMLRVGERTGQMGEMMERIAAFYDEEMARWVDWFTRLFEPLLMVFIGVMIGTIVVLMYMPIFELAGSIQ